MPPANILVAVEDGKAGSFVGGDVGECFAFFGAPDLVVSIVDWTVLVFSGAVLVGFVAYVLPQMVGRNVESSPTEFCLRLLNYSKLTIEWIIGKSEQGAGGQTAVKTGFWRARNARGLINIAVVYCVILPSISIMFLPETPRGYQLSTGALLAALQIWLWSNVFGDYCGLLITRRILEDLPQRVEMFEAETNIFGTVRMWGDCRRICNRPA